MVQGIKSPEARFPLDRPGLPLPGAGRDDEVRPDAASQPLGRPRPDDLHLLVDVLQPASHSVSQAAGGR